MKTVAQPFYLSSAVPVPLQLWFGFWDMFFATAIQGVSLGVMGNAFMPLKTARDMSRIAGTEPPTAE